ncbi:acyl-CoA dehydrogenase family protein [Sphingobium sp. HBC34]|uniref:Acyl-CoA dehydrogenase family protein n=1 Tax=Sphingobium cyanobacteriorum TaxID=3063954 RepID=A0ABT8ZPL5_9SPHN|nr:acyl-CoA dehydrogenase family protein [Sphingobium sp. HBC34]MDO7836388.1 acyl-CoA dehydrogenase family protein [Sphingobium sp. HBC34]
MDFNYSDLQRMLLDSAERFITEHFTLEHRRSLRDSANGLDEVAWATFAELGWLALAIPEDLGGLGGTQADIAVLAAATGGKCVSQPVISTAVLGTHILSGATAPRTELLEQIVGGAARIALVHGEPGERYAGAAPRAVTLTADGDGFAISGQKLLALDAPSATHLIVSAMLEGEGFALVLVEADSAGMSVENYPLLDGSRAADIRFETLRVHGDAVLATGKKAEALLMEALDRATLARLAQSVGSMEEILRICSAYLKERQQFGQPIGKFQALQHIMADMFVVTHQARSALYQALAHAELSAAERSRALSLAAITIGEAGQLVSRQGIQLHGGYGVTDEYEISHHYRYLLTLEKISGDLDYHMSRVGQA